MKVYLKKVPKKLGYTCLCETGEFCYYYENGIDPIGECIKKYKCMLNQNLICYKQVFPKRVKIVKDKTINTCGLECYFKDKKCPLHSFNNYCRKNKFHYELIK